MAANYVVYTQSYTLTANAAKSAILLNPATAAFRIFEVGVSFDNIAVTDEPILCELYRVATTGSPAGTSRTPALLDERDIAAQSTALVQLSTEPTSKTLLYGWFVQPNSGLFVLQDPLGREPVGKGAGLRIGLLLTTVIGVSPKAAAYFKFEE